MSDELKRVLAESAKWIELISLAALEYSDDTPGSYLVSIDTTLQGARNAARLLADIKAATGDMERCAATEEQPAA